MDARTVFVLLGVVGAAMSITNSMAMQNWRAAFWGGIALGWMLLYHFSFNACVQ